MEQSRFLWDKPSSVRTEGGGGCVGDSRLMELRRRTRSPIACTVCNELGDGPAHRSWHFKSERKLARPVVVTPFAGEASVAKRLYCGDCRCPAPCGTSGLTPSLHQPKRSTRSIGVTVTVGHPNRGDAQRTVAVLSNRRAPFSGSAPIQPSETPVGRGNARQSERRRGSTERAGDRRW